MPLSDFPEINKLSMDEKLDLVMELWDSIIPEVDKMPIPQWQKDELDRRLAEHEAHPERAIPFEEVMRRIKYQK